MVVVRLDEWFVSFFRDHKRIKEGPTIAIDMSCYMILSADRDGLAKGEVRLEAEFGRRGPAQSLVERINELREENQETFFVKERGKALWRIYVRTNVDPSLVSEDMVFDSRLCSARGDLQFWDEVLTLEEAGKEVAQTNLRLSQEMVRNGLSLQAFVSPDVTTDPEWPNDHEKQGATAYFERYVEGLEPPRKKAKPWDDFVV